MYMYIHIILYGCVCIDISQDFELYNNNTNIYMYILYRCVYIYSTYVALHEITVHHIGYKARAW